MKCVRFQFVWMVVAIAGAAGALADPVYTMSAISVPDTTYAVASGVNDSGCVAGSAGDAVSGLTIAWVTGAGGTGAYTVPSLGSSSGYSYNSFYAINNAGTAVGYSTIDDEGVTRYRAVRYDGTTQIDIGTLGGGNSYAYGINNAGTIVGVANVTSTVQHAFAYTDGAMTDLGALGTGTYSQAYGINDAGVIAGYSTTYYESGAHAFRYQDGIMTDLGLPEGVTASYGTCISENGYIGGYGIEGSSGVSVPLLDTGLGLKDIGYLYASSEGDRRSASINDVNSDGIAVGYTFTADYQQVGLIYMDGTLYDLNDFLPAEYEGWRITNGYSISENGWIAATAVVSGSYSSNPFLLRLVPEPSSLVLLIPLLALCRRVRA